MLRMQYLGHYENLEKKFRVLEAHEKIKKKVREGKNPLYQNNISKENNSVLSIQPTKRIRFKNLRKNMKMQ